MNFVKKNENLQLIQVNFNKIRLVISLEGWDPITKQKYLFTL